MTTDDLVVVRTFTNAVDAEVAAGVLEAAGIECMIRRDDCGGMRPQLWLSGVEVVVRAEDAARAAGLLANVQA